MKYLIKWRWLTSLFVIGAVIAIIFTSPDLVKLANEKGQIEAPEGSSFSNYEQLMEDIGEDNNVINAVVSLDKELDDSIRTDLKEYIKDIENTKNVISVTSPFLSKEVEEKLVSEDNQHVMIPITTIDNDDETSRIATKVKDRGDHLFESVHLTGNSLVIDDINENTITGLQKTEIITLILIVAILVIVFRSVVAPFVPLLIVGLAYLGSQGILAFLIRDFDFPTSNYISSFLVAILFGIGTDYCILILNRFKEELANGKDKFEATLTALKTSGRTILIAAITVLVGFVALFFVEFSLFKSAVGIAVAVVVMLIIMFTVLPLLMSIFGEKLFWPSKNGIHKDNRLWGKLGNWSFKRPAVMLLIPVILTVGLILSTNNKISYDSTKEISDDYDSIKALNIINENFGRGTAFPIEMVLSSDDNHITSERLSDVESLAKAIEKVEGVDSVNTVTRPTGEVIKDLTVTSQLNELSNNMDQSIKGISEVSSGLSQIQKEIEPLTEEQQILEAMLSMGELPAEALPEVSKEYSNEAKKLNSGIEESREGLNQVENGQNEINDYIEDMSESDKINDSGIYLTDDILNDKEFKQAIDMYSYDDRRVVNLQIELSDNPYSEKAIKTLSNIKEIAKNQINDTSLEDDDIYYGGMTSSNSDLKDVIDQDMNTTIFLMTGALFIILVVFMKSLIMPLYMTISILLTYYASIGVTNLIYADVGLTMMVPFFSFVLLMTLGVDYAIFLMTRFNEEYKGDVKDALITAMKKMGMVIMVAAVILIGTFAALIASGALTLIQISITVIVGLLLYNLIMLPIFIPSLISSFKKGNWWPFVNSYDK